MLQYNNQLCFKRVYFVLQMAKWQSFVSRDKKLHTPFLTVGYPCCHSFKLLLHYISKHIYIFVYLYGILTLLWYRFRVVCCCFLWGWSTHIWNIYSYDSSSKLKKNDIGTKEHDHVTDVTDFHNHMQPTVYEKICQVFTLDTCHF